MKVPSDNLDFGVFFLKKQEIKKKIKASLTNVDAWNVMIFSVENRFKVHSNHVEL